MGGKRVEYDLDTRGEEPTCIGQPGQDLVGKFGKAAGYGQTETGYVNNFTLTANMTIKDNGWCAEELRAKFGKHLTNRRKLINNLPNGINDQILCTRGEQARD